MLLRMVTAGEQRAAGPWIGCPVATLRSPKGCDPYQLAPRPNRQPPLGLPRIRPDELYVQGTPASKNNWYLGHDAEAQERVGVCVFAIDRPGIGRSDLHRGRMLLSWVDDVRAFADALGLPTFSVLGYSCGAPYAWACSARLPERVDCVAVVSGMVDTAHPVRTARSKTSLGQVNCNHELIQVASPLHDDRRSVDGRPARLPPGGHRSRQLFIEGAAAIKVTLLVAWVGVDTHGVSSAYITADSRISRGEVGHFDQGRKVLSFSRHADILGYCGDVLFPSLVLGQVVQLAEAGMLFSAEQSSQDRFEEITQRVNYLSREYPAASGLLENSLSIIHASRGGDRDQEFSVRTLVLSKGNRWKADQADGLGAPFFRAPVPSG